MSAKELQAAWIKTDTHIKEEHFAETEATGVLLDIITEHGHISCSTLQVLAFLHCDGQQDKPNVFLDLIFKDSNEGTSVNV